MSTPAKTCCELRSKLKPFPRWTRFRQDRPMLYWGEVNKVGEEVPLYTLGWMVRAKGIDDFIIRYCGLGEYWIRPNWFKYGCEPADLEVLYRSGLMVPAVQLFGPDHTFIQLAMNRQGAIQYLYTGDGVKTVVRQAMLSLGFKEGSFDAFTNLMWVQWPLDRKFPVVPDNFPCIGEHYWPERKRQPGDEETGERRLPQVPEEVALVIKQEYSSLLKEA